jgi:formylmethanofuran dehydrogenase subunit E
VVDTQNTFLSGTSPIDRVGLYTWEEYIRRVNSFHGYAAPGVIIGGIMISIAMERIPKGILFNAICETSSCLPNSVQLLTPCTVGNGWLRIINLGRFAVSIYDKKDGNGVRIYLDANKLQNWDEIQAWFLKLKNKHEQDIEKLRKQIKSAGRDIYTLHTVRVKSQYLTKYSKGSIGVCKVCSEAYPVNDGTICLGCQGNSPYDTDTSSILR